MTELEIDSLVSWIEDDTIKPSYDVVRKKLKEVSCAYRALEIKYKIICAEHRAEKERADKAEAALKLIKPVITCYTEPSEDVWDDLLDDKPTSPRLEGEWPS